MVLIFMLANHHNIMFDWAMMFKLFGIYLKVFFLVLLTWLLVSYLTNLYESNRYLPFVERIKNLSPEIGGFAGLYSWGDHFLVGTTDGVGTKLKLAFKEKRHKERKKAKKGGNTK